MSRVKGQPKTGGREKGTPNRVTRDVRRWLFELMQNNLEALEADLEGMDAEKRWAIFEKILPYLLTKRDPQMIYRWEYSDEAWEKVQEQFDIDE